MDLNRNHIESLPIEDLSSVGACRRKANQYASWSGFGKIETEEIAISVSELATNVINHGGGKGLFVICGIRDEQSHEGLEIWCFDYGEGILNTRIASRDGYSSRNSLGIGIGSMQRLSDEFEINPQELPKPIKTVLPSQMPIGTCFYLRKWLTNAKWTGGNKKLIIGAASRPKPGETFNGDCYIVQHLSNGLSLAAVIDGLGHGKEAHMASQLAKERILSKPNLPLDTLMKYIHAAIRGTRGATVGIALLDTGSGKLVYTGIGNIEGQVVNESKARSLTSLGGIVGHNIRTPRIFEYEYHHMDNLILYSDGIASGWQNRVINWQNQPQQIAEEILYHHSRINDDATVLVLRNAS
ncbi:MAG: SpoIIE family protein phosphatase [Deltaproteobacteria bacterium]|nr:SpoIIE family protein phosphatase [Deltaproteobacteria bacterium]